MRVYYPADDHDEYDDEHHVDHDGVDHDGAGHHDDVTGVDDHDGTDFHDDHDRAEADGLRVAGAR